MDDDAAERELRLLVAAVVLVVDFAASEDLDAVDEVVEGAASVVGVEPLTTEVVDPAEAVDCSAMPRPRVLATPTLSQATSARLRAAGWGRLVGMHRTVRIGSEPLVRGG